MGKKILTVRIDLSQGIVMPGDIVQCFEGRLKILDTKYRNKFGEFFLCEVLNEQVPDTQEQDEKGVLINPNNPYEIIGTLHMPGLRYFLTVPGFFIKERNTGEVKGFSFHESFHLLFQKGAVNAEATLKKGQYHSFQFADGLPSFRSHYWKIKVYDEDGKAYVALTDEAKAELGRMMKRRKKGS